MTENHDDILNPDEAKDIVRKGYNTLSADYTKIRKLSTRDRKYIDLLLERLPKGSRVLDLGCGGGTPSTKELARTYKVVGIDFAKNQIKLARKNIPNAKFHQMDMTKMTFEDEEFDAVFSLLAIIHVPRELKVQLYKDIHRILKPGGFLLIAIGCDNWISEPGDDFMGEPMYWSQWGGELSKEMIEKAGFKIIQASIEEAWFGGELERHFFVLARKV